MSRALFKLPDADRRRRINRLRGQIVDLVVSAGRDDRQTTHRGTVIGAASNLAGGMPTYVVVELDDGRIVTASSAIVVSIENPKEPSS